MNNKQIFSIKNSFLKQLGAVVFFLNLKKIWIWDSEHLCHNLCLCGFILNYNALVHLTEEKYHQFTVYPFNSFWAAMEVNDTEE